MISRLFVQNTGAGYWLNNIASDPSINNEGVQTISLYGYKSFSASGIPTVNTSNVYVGIGNPAALPIILSGNHTTNSYTLNLVDKNFVHLSNIYWSASSGDGLYIFAQ